MLTGSCSRRQVARRPAGECWHDVSHGSRGVPGIEPGPPAIGRAAPADTSAARRRRLQLPRCNRGACLRPDLNRRPRRQAPWARMRALTSELWRRHLPAAGGSVEPLGGATWWQVIKKPPPKRGPVCRPASAGSAVVSDPCPADCWPAEPACAPTLLRSSGSTSCRGIRSRRIHSVSTCGSCTRAVWPRRYRAVLGGAGTGAAPLLQPQFPQDHLPPGPSEVEPPQLGQFAIVITSMSSRPLGGAG